MLRLIVFFSHYNEAKANNNALHLISINRC